MDLHQEIDQFRLRLFRRWKDRNPVPLEVFELDRYLWSWWNSIVPDYDKWR